MKKYPMQDYDLAMKTRWYVSKNHPLNYQKKIINTVQQEERKKKGGVAAIL
jgi:hypothetical protein